MGQFVNLHSHTSHSVRDGLAGIDELVDRAAQLGQPAVAITDHGTLSGGWKLAKAAQAAGIKPIVGAELYVSIGSRHERAVDAVPADLIGADGGPVRTDAAEAPAPGGYKASTFQHLTVLAQTSRGYRNLSTMSAAASESFWIKPRVDLDLIGDHHDGLVLLTGCLSGPVAGALLRDGTRRPDGSVFDGWAAAQRAVEQLIGVFHGRDHDYVREHLFVEVMDHGIAEERALTPRLFELAQRYGLRAVATNDSHYVHADDHDTHDMWLCIRSSSGGKPVPFTDRRRVGFSGHGYHLRDHPEMTAAFARYGDAGRDAVRQSLAIAEMIDDRVLPESRRRLPAFPTPDGFGSAVDYLHRLIDQGAEQRYGDRWRDRRPDVLARIRHEFTVIRRLGLADYFLIVRDVVTWARGNGIRVGPGRGSAAGSCVSYCLGIVQVDPLSAGLLFERFLDADRDELPDIDLDFDQAGQQRVFEYLNRRWGADRVARLGTFGFARARYSLRSAARVMLPPERAGRVADGLARLVPGPQHTLRDLADPAFAPGAAIREKASSTTDTRLVFDNAVRIEGVVQSEGVHACGVVIATEPLAPLVPLRLDRRPQGGWVTQWDGRDIADLGLLKLDVLGLRNLDIINDCVTQIRDTTGETVAPEHLPVEPAHPQARATWAMLSAGRTAGVFQLESSGIAKLASEVRPENLEDLSALVALYRPGPMSAGFHDRYARRKHGLEPVDYGIFTNDPAEQAVLASVLGSTFGLIVYQEQLMQLGTSVAGFGPAENNRLRRAVSKKKQAEMDAVGRLFIQGATTEFVSDGVVDKRAFAPETANRLWDAMKGAGNYSFNKCLTGDTVLQTATNYTWTIGDLYRRLHCIDTCGPNCGWCADRPAKVRGLCPGCYNWHVKFRGRGLTLLAYDFDDGRIRPKRVKDVHFNGVKPVYKVTLADGKHLRATGNHRLLTPHGWSEVGDLRPGDRLLVDGGYEQHQYTPDEYRVTVGERSGKGRLYAPGEANIGFIDGGSAALTAWTDTTISTARCSRPGSHAGRLERAHLNGNRTDNRAAKLEWMCASHHKRHDYTVNGRKRRWDKGHPAVPIRVESITYDGECETYDVEMDDDGHNFTANGIVSHNSHSYAYGTLSYITAFLKANWPAQFGAATLACTDTDTRRAATLAALRHEGIEVLGPSVTQGAVATVCGPDLRIRLGLAEIKGVGIDVARAVVAARHIRGGFSGLGDLAASVTIDQPPASGGGDASPESRPITTAQLQALIESGACDDFGPRKGQLMALAALRGHPELRPVDAEFSSVERAARERDRLGTLVSESPLTSARRDIACWTTPSQGTKPIPVHKLPSEDGAQVVTLGVLSAFTVRAGAAGPRAHITLDGSKGSVDGIIWPSTLARLERAGTTPAAGDVVALRGKLATREVHAFEPDGADDDTGPEENPDGSPSEADYVRELRVSDVYPVHLPDDSRLTLADAPALADLIERATTTNRAPVPAARLTLVWPAPEPMDPPTSTPTSKDEPTNPAKVTPVAPVAPSTIPGATRRSVPALPPLEPTARLTRPTIHQVEQPATAPASGAARVHLYDLPEGANPVYTLGAARAAVLARWPGLEAGARRGGMITPIDLRELSPGRCSPAVSSTTDSDVLIVRIVPADQPPRLVVHAADERVVHTGDPEAILAAIGVAGTGISAA